MNMPNILDITQLHVDYHGFAVLKDVSLQVATGSITVLVGLNGAGKTTLLKAVSGLKAWSAGDIVFAGDSIAGQQPASLVARGLLQVPEGRHLFGQMTVRENLELGGYLRTGRQRRADLERVFHLFPILRERTEQLGGTMSGGQQQMLAIGRALVTGPSLILLDEPSQGLAPMVIETVLEMLRELKAEGMSMLLVEQNVQMALDLAERVLILDQGAIVFEGSAAELVGDDQVTARYLGVGV